MSFLAKASGAFSFAHLVNLGMGAKGKRADDDDDDDKRKDDDDKDKDARSRADGGNDGDKRDDDDDDKDARGRGAKAEDDGKKPDDDDDSGKGKHAEDDDDDDEEMKKAARAGFGRALAAARRGERTRIGRITSAPAAASRLATALHLAVNTGLSSREAISLLGTVPEAKPAGGALREAMARLPRLQPGDDGGNATAATPGSSLLAATKRLAETDKARRGARS